MSNTSEYQVILKYHSSITMLSVVACFIEKTTVHHLHHNPISPDGMMILVGGYSLDQVLLGYSGAFHTWVRIPTFHVIRSF